MKEITVDSIITERPCGSVTPLVIDLDGRDFPIIIIKEYKEMIEGIKEDIEIGLKSTTIGNKKVNIYLLVVKLGEDYSRIYDIWFNYGIEGHKEFLKLLKEEKSIVFDLRDENNERIISLGVDNILKEHIDYYIDKAEEVVVTRGEIRDNIISLEKASKHNTWKEEDVFELMDKIFEDYESIEDLWNNL